MILVAAHSGKSTTTGYACRLVKQKLFVIFPSGAFDNILKICDHFPSHSARFYYSFISPERCPLNLLLLLFLQNFSILMFP